MSDEDLVKKASIAVRVATKMLAGVKEKLGERYNQALEDQGIDLMTLDAHTLIRLEKRMRGIVPKTP